MKFAELVTILIEDKSELGRFLADHFRAERPCPENMIPLCKNQNKRPASAERFSKLSPVFDIHAPKWLKSEIERTHAATQEAIRDRNSSYYTGSSGVRYYRGEQPSDYNIYYSSGLSKNQESRLLNFLNELRQIMELDLPERLEFFTFEKLQEIDIQFYEPIIDLLYETEEFTTACYMALLVDIIYKSYGIPFQSPRRYFNTGFECWDAKLRRKRQEIISIQSSGMEFSRFAAQTSTIDFIAYPQNGPLAGMNILWLAAISDQVHLVKQFIFQKDIGYDETYLNYAPSDKQHEGMTVCWLLLANILKKEDVCHAYRRQCYSLSQAISLRNLPVEIISQCEAQTLLTAVPQKGFYKGKTLLQLLLENSFDNTVEILPSILEQEELHPLLEELQENKSLQQELLITLAKHKQWDIFSDIAKFCSLIQNNSAKGSENPNQKCISILKVLSDENILNDLYFSRQHSPGCSLGAFFEVMAILPKTKAEIQKETAVITKDNGFSAVNELTSNYFREISRLCLLELIEIIEEKHYGERLKKLFYSKLIALPSKMGETLSAIIKSCGETAELQDLLRHIELVNNICVNAMFDHCPPRGTELFESDISCADFINATLETKSEIVTTYFRLLAHIQTIKKYSEFKPEQRHPPFKKTEVCLLEKQKKYNIDFTATAGEGPCEGLTLVNQFALNRDWETVMMLLQENQELDVYGMPEEGKYQDKNLFLFAALDNQWEIVEFLLDELNSGNGEETFQLTNEKPCIKNSVNTALLAAIAQGKLDIACKIIKKFELQNTTIPNIVLMRDQCPDETILLNTPLLGFLKFLMQNTIDKKILLNSFRLDLENIGKSVSTNDFANSPSPQLQNILKRLIEVLDNDKLSNRFELLGQLNITDFTHQTIEVIINLLNTFNETKLASYLFLMKWAAVEYDDENTEAKDQFDVENNVDHIINKINHPEILHEIMRPLLQLAASRQDKFSSLVNQLFSAKATVELDLNAGICIEENHELSILTQLTLHNSWETIYSILETYENVAIDLDLASTQWGGKNLLSVAAFHQQWELVQLILKKFPHVNINAASAHTQSDHNNTTTLYFAAMDDTQITKTTRQEIIISLLYRPDFDISIVPENIQRTFIEYIYNLNKTVVNRTDNTLPGIIEKLYFLHLQRLNIKMDDLCDEIQSQNKKNPYALDADTITCLNYPPMLLLFRHDAWSNRLLRKFSTTYLEDTRELYHEIKKLAMNMACLLPRECDESSGLYMLPIEVRCIIAKILLRQSRYSDINFNFILKLFEDREHYINDFSEIDRNVTEHLAEKSLEITSTRAVRIYRQELGFFNPKNNYKNANNARTKLKEILKTKQENGVKLTQNLRNLIVWKFKKLAHENPNLRKSVVLEAIDDAIALAEHGCDIGSAKPEIHFLRHGKLRSNESVESTTSEVQESECISAKNIAHDAVEEYCDEMGLCHDDVTEKRKEYAVDFIEKRLETKQIKEGCIFTQSMRNSIVANFGARAEQQESPVLRPSEVLQIIDVPVVAQEPQISATITSPAHSQ